MKEPEPFHEIRPTVPKGSNFFTSAIQICSVPDPMCWLWSKFEIHGTHSKGVARVEDRCSFLSDLSRDREQSWLLTVQLGHIDLVVVGSKSFPVHSVAQLSRKSQK